MGEDPWEDLPVRSMPGFEDEQERRARQDRENQRLDEEHVAGDVRVKACPHCGNAIERTQGCNHMVCHSPPGCGRSFDWNTSQPHRPNLQEVQQPPGFSAIVSWLTKQDFSVQGAAAALSGLSPEDRRYAFANAAACCLLKRGETSPGLAQAIMSNPELQAELGFVGEAQRFKNVAAVLCDISMLTSRSLPAAVLAGHDGWDGVAQGQEGKKGLRNALVNLLVAVLGSPDNNHLSMLLLEPTAMVNTFPVGFVFGLMPGPEGWHFDCGCVMDDLGRVSRPRPPLENQHLHFLNFCTWAVLAIGLLVFEENCTNIDQVLTRPRPGEIDLYPLED